MIHTTKETDEFIGKAFHKEWILAVTLNITTLSDAILFDILSHTEYKLELVSYDDSYTVHVRIVRL